MPLVRCMPAILITPIIRSSTNPEVGEPSSNVWLVRDFLMSKVDVAKSRKKLRGNRSRRSGVQRIVRRRSSQT